MSTALPELAKRLIDANAFVVLTTLNPDGAPQSSVVWVKRDGDDILFSTIRGRRKTRNMERDPRVSICGFDLGNPYRYFEVRGTVALDEEGGRALIDELSERYLGRKYEVEPPGTVRVVCRLSATRAIARQ